MVSCQCVKKIHISIQILKWCSFDSADLYLPQKYAIASKQVCSIEFSKYKLFSSYK